MVIFSVLLISLIFVTDPVRAESQDACAIWLCLPAGFPQGCAGAYGEFKYRLKKRRPPLPDLSSCTTGPNGEKSKGHYQLGYEKYYPCEDGFKLKVKIDPEAGGWARCISDNHNKLPCSYKKGLNISHNGDRCHYYYPAKRRQKPSYIKMWVNGEYLGQYFW